jgi:hypothetical protein
MNKADEGLADAVEIAVEVFFAKLSRMRLVLTQSTVSFVVSLAALAAAVLRTSGLVFVVIVAAVLLLGEYVGYRYVKEQNIYGSKASSGGSCDSGKSSPCDSCSSKGSSCLGLYQNALSLKIARAEQQQLKKIFSSPLLAQAGVLLAIGAVELIAVLTDSLHPTYSGLISLAFDLTALLGVLWMRHGAKKISAAKITEK